MLSQLFHNLKSKITKQNKISFKKILADGHGQTAKTDFANLGPYQLFTQQ